jgi:sugar lactone lactonase YvrE
VSRQREAGFSVVLVVVMILVLLVLGIGITTVVVEDSDVASNHIEATQAFYAAHAGVEYAILKLAGNSGWTGLPRPGKPVGVGAFWVAPPDTLDAGGRPLAAGRKRIVVTGIVGKATRVLEVHVAPGTIRTIGQTAEGTGVEGTSWTPDGLAVSPAGDLYVADASNHVVRCIDLLTGVTSIVAGSGAPGWSGDGGRATAARLTTPRGLAVAPDGDLYIADAGTHTIRRVSAASGSIATIAGRGRPGSDGDGGPATSARLSDPCAIAISGKGDLFIADRGNHKIRVIFASTGSIETVAGQGQAGFSGDGGSGKDARLRSPRGVAVGSNGDIYIADSGNHVVRRLAASTGILTTIAGIGLAGFAGDGGAAVLARLSSPEGLDVGPWGDLYIADTGNHRVRRLEIESGTITTIAGNGVVGAGGDSGPSSAAQFDSPGALAVASTGAYYVGDRGSHRVRMVTGILSIVAWIEART